MRFLSSRRKDVGGEEPAEEEGPESNTDVLPKATASNRRTSKSTFTSAVSKLGKKDHQKQETERLDSVPQQEEVKASPKERTPRMAARNLPRRSPTSTRQDHENQFARLHDVLMHRSKGASDDRLLYHLVQSSSTGSMEGEPQRVPTATDSETGSSLYSLSRLAIDREKAKSMNTRDRLRLWRSQKHVLNSEVFNSDRRPSSRVSAAHRRRFGSSSKSPGQEVQENNQEDCVQQEHEDVAKPLTKQVRFRESDKL